MAVEAIALPRLEMAHVLFMDIVGYSKLPMEQQQSVLSQLQHAVRDALHRLSAQDSEQLIRLPTGDGMALVFFGDPEAPVRCALELAQSVRSSPEIRLRMGIHTGPVYRIADINANLNVSGGGINLAQRVMDCGDAGHILVSAAVAEVLSQLSAWKHSLRDIGEAEVKHGIRVHLFNLCTSCAGNPEPPHAVQRRTTQYFRQRLTLWTVAVIVLAVAAGMIWRIRPARDGTHGVASAPKTASPPGTAAVQLTKDSPAGSTVQQPSSAASALPVPSSASPRGTSRAPESPGVKVAKGPAKPPPTKQPRQLAGYYAGQFSQPGMRDFPATIFLDEQAGVVTGCLQATGFGGGPVRGVASGNHLVATVLTKTSRTELQGQSFGTELRGTYSVFGRSGTKQGRFTLQRQADTGRPAKFAADSCPAM